MWNAIFIENTVPNGRDECCKPLIYEVSIHMMRVSKIWSFCLSLIILWIMLSDKRYSLDISYLSIIRVGYNLFYKNQYSYFAGTTFIFHIWTVHFTVLPPVFFFKHFDYMRFRIHTLHNTFGVALVLCKWFSIRAALNFSIVIPESKTRCSFKKTNNKNNKNQVCSLVHFGRNKINSENSDPINTSKTNKMPLINCLLHDQEHFKRENNKDLQTLFLFRYAIQKYIKKFFYLYIYK